MAIDPERECNTPTLMGAAHSAKAAEPTTDKMPAETVERKVERMDKG
tara:strand:+ start:735 stop:875 length:141 start_codon:yes stop_codon:yes gene_type:complete